jgi:hypothetical protein
MVGKKATRATLLRMAFFGKTGTIGRIKDHHQGYIDWEEFERNQKQPAANAYSKAGDVKSGRGGPALLAGLLMCARCGRRLSIAYKRACSEANRLSV